EWGVGKGLTHADGDAIHAVRAGEACRAYSADDGYLRLFCEGRLKPEGRRYCPSWSELGVTCQAERTITRLRLDRRCRLLIKGFGHRHRRGVARSHCRYVKQIFSRYELTIERALCVAHELLYPASVFPHCALALSHWSVPFVSLSTTSFGLSASMSLSARAAPYRWSGDSLARA